MKLPSVAYFISLSIAYKGKGIYFKNKSYCFMYLLTAVELMLPLIPSDVLLMVVERIASPSIASSNNAMFLISTTLPLTSFLMFTLLAYVNIV